MKTFGMKTVIRMEIENVLCNKCGGPCRVGLCGGFDFADLRLLGGYGSNFDGERHESHICEPCYTEIIKTFKILPTVTEDMGLL